MPAAATAPTTAAMLAARRDELQRAIARRDVITVERHADPMDSIQPLVEREAGAVMLEKLSAELVSVEDALARLRADAYGVCEDCGRAIPTLRLQAVPWASWCVGCQQAADAERAADCGRLQEEC
jgi:DnaK suppressor protein